MKKGIIMALLSLMLNSVFSFFISCIPSHNSSISPGNNALKIGFTPIYWALTSVYADGIDSLKKLCFSADEMLMRVFLPFKKNDRAIVENSK